ncbi:alpha-amylase family glycosyl hydrolase [Thermodesulfobacteriota bacterium]
MTDRFRDGNPCNNRAGRPALYSPSHPKFFHGGDLAGIGEAIPYLKELGVTAVWITPVYKQIGMHPDKDGGYGTGYHGYWADLADPYEAAVEPKLGSADELSELIGNLQSAGTGIKVIFDMIVNHPGYGATIVKQHRNWFNKYGDCDWEKDPINCPLFGLPDFDQGNEKVREYLTSLSKKWVDRYPVRGIRMDTAKHVPIDYLQEWVEAVRSVRPNIFLIAEVFQSQKDSRDSIEDLKKYFEVGFDSAFNFLLKDALVSSIAQGGNVNQVAKVVKQTMEAFAAGNSKSRHKDQQLYLVNMLDNHDMPRFINTPGYGTPEDEIIRRHRLALALLFTLPGIPQVYYGTELGLYGGDDPDNRFDMPYWAWAKENRLKAEKRFRLNPVRFMRDPESTFEFLKNLIGIRKKNMPLSIGHYTELPPEKPAGHPNVYAFARNTDKDCIVVIVNNADRPSGKLSFPIQSLSDLPHAAKDLLKNGTRLRDLIGLDAPKELVVQDGEITIRMERKALGIYRPSRNAK